MTFSGFSDNTTPQPKKDLPRISGSEAVIRSFLEEGVETIFGYPGGAIIPVYDALYDYRDKVNHILVRHEQCAIHAAQGYARATGKTGVCIVTSGPGATNTVTGLADAMLDSTPVVLISGQVASNTLGTDAFQEINFIEITNSVTKWNCQVKRAEDIPEAIARAFYIAASGRPGPVVVDITKDVTANVCEFENKAVDYPAKPVKYTEEDIEQAISLINQAKKPYIYLGGGVIASDASPEVKELAEKLGVSASAVSQWESGNKSPRPDNWKRLAEVFGVSVAYVKGEENKPTFPKGLSQALIDAVMELNLEECEHLRNLVNLRAYKLQKAALDAATKEGD